MRIATMYLYLTHTKLLALFIKGAIAKAEEIVNSLGASGMLLQQFNNPDNPKVGYTNMSIKRNWLVPQYFANNCCNLLQDPP